MNVDPPLALLVIAWGVVLDLITLFLDLRWNVRGHGPSGVPVIPWMLYLWAVVVSKEPVPLDGDPALLFRALNLLMLTGFHVLCQYWIAVWHQRWRGSGAERRDGGSSSSD